MDKSLITISIITIIILGIVAFSSKDIDEKREVELLKKNAGNVSNYLYSLNYGTKDYEKINVNNKYLISISFEEIASYYINRGYDIRWIKTGQYDGHYIAIKLKNN